MEVFIMKNMKNKIALSVLALVALGSSQTANAWNFRAPSTSNEKAVAVVAGAAVVAAGYYGVKALWSWMSTPKAEPEAAPEAAPVVLGEASQEELVEALESGTRVVDAEGQDVVESILQELAQPVTLERAQEINNTYGQNSSIKAALKKASIKDAGKTAKIAFKKSL